MNTLWALLLDNYWRILPYFLGASLFVTIVTRSFPAFRALSILYADWAACSYLIGASGSHGDWVLLASIDAVAAGLLLLCQRRMEAALAISFVFEIVLHAAYGWHEVVHVPAEDADIFHYWTTFLVAWGQAIGVVAWGCFNGGKRYPAGGGVRSPASYFRRSVALGNRESQPAFRGRDD